MLQILSLSSPFSGQRSSGLSLSPCCLSLLCCLLYLLLTLLFCLHSHCIHQILDSVSYTHQHGIVHRDLKVFVCVCVSFCCVTVHLQACVLCSLTCACGFKQVACACCLPSCLRPAFCLGSGSARCTIVDGLKRKRSFSVGPCVQDRAPERSCKRCWKQGEGQSGKRRAASF